MNDDAFGGFYLTDYGQIRLNAQQGKLAELDDALSKCGLNGFPPFREFIRQETERMRADGRNNE